MYLRRITLRARLLLTMAVVTISLLALGAWGVIANQVGTSRVSALFDEAQATSDAVARLRESLSNLRRLQANIIAVGSSNTNEVERLIGLWKAEAEAVRSHGNALVKGDPGHAEMAALVKAQGDQLAAYVAAIGPIAEQLQQAKIDGAVALAYAERAEDTATALLQSADAMLKAGQGRQADIRERMAAELLQSVVRAHRAKKHPVTRELLDKAAADQGRSVSSLIDQCVRDQLSPRYGDLQPRLQRFLSGVRQP